MEQTPRKWVLVADGERAKVFKREGRTLVHIGSTHHMEEDVTLHKDKGKHRPGRTLQRVSAVPHTYATHTDWHRFEKAAFAKEIAKIINHSSSDFERLTVIAPPQTLGELRQHLDDMVMKKVDKQIPRDVTKMATDDILEYIENY
ncbi:MAG: Host attachment protein [Chlamydiales bacterium]|nr:Host attachment protein [Chlamydiales bacterium]